MTRMIYQGGGAWLPAFPAQDHDEDDETRIWTMLESRLYVLGRGESAPPKPPSPDDATVAPDGATVAPDVADVADVADSVPAPGTILPDAQVAEATAKRVHRRIDPAGTDAAVAEGQVP